MYLIVGDDCARGTYHIFVAVINSYDQADVHAISKRVIHKLAHAGIFISGTNVVLCSIERNDIKIIPSFS